MVTPRAEAGPSSRETDPLHVVVQAELVRVRAKGHRVVFLDALVLDPGVDDVLGEYAAFEQPLMVGLQLAEHLEQ